MRRKQIYIAPQQEDELKRLAERRGVSESMLIREAVARYLVDEEPLALESMEEHPLWKIIGLIDDPDAPTDWSVNYKKDLYGSPDGPF